MTEDDLTQLLNQCEPAAPDVDQVAIIERLTKSGDSVGALGSWPRAWRMRNTRVTIAAIAFAATMLALVTLMKINAAPGPDALVDARVSKTTQLASKFEESLSRSEQLEAEVTALLASRRSEVPTMDHEPTWTKAGDGFDTLANLRAELRASEGLWLLVSDDVDPDNPVSPDSIIELYPETPAAARCQRLIAK